MCALILGALSLFVSKHDITGSRCNFGGTDTVSLSQIATSSVNAGKLLYNECGYNEFHI